jgi:alpha-L-arabinofuranosidase
LWGEDVNQILIETQKRRFETSKDLYGIFFEDINRVGDGGIYPEMLRNRSFEDSIVPDECEAIEDGKYFITPTGFKSAFNNGEGLDQWLEAVPPTKIPAWYISRENEDVEISLDEADVLNKNRRSSLVISFKEEGTSNSVYNIGYTGLNVQNGEKYNFFMFAKTTEHNQTLEVSLRSKCGNKIYGTKTFEVTSGEYAKYDCVLTSDDTDVDATFHITSKNKGVVKIGFSSLMPVETYKRRINGVRKDIAELLKGMNSRFLRFPGGCIVEGITKETALKFANTIGPVWERPSHWLLWFYRTTNGLGFHEYLQLCEDLDLEPMYVINCGMTCQHRHPDFFNDELANEYLQDAINAIEYATAPADSCWGSIRAKNGHPEPFNMKYIEIGNENYGEEYNKRYLQFYNALKEKFPNIIYIANTHTELDGLPTEIADEHFYNDTEFFASNQKKYDNYDRKGPEIFVGEYAVTFNEVNASLYSALGEAVFLTGLEHNQDIVKMSAYAPLFLNSNYKSWFPNLIVFNTHESFGIPSYYMLQMMGESRGDYVVESSTETSMITDKKHGRAGLFAEKAGVVFSNVTIDGNKQNTIAGNITGEFIVCNDEYVAATDSAWCLFGDEKASDYTLSADVKFNNGQSAIRMSVWNERMENIGSAFQPYWLAKRLKSFTWIIENGESYIQFEKRSLIQNTSEKIKVNIDYNVTNSMKMAAKGNKIECYLNGNLINTYTVVPYPAITSVVTVDDKTNEAIIKIINISDKNEAVKINLDQKVRNTAKGLILESADKYDCNSFENKTNVSPKSFTIDNAASEFVYDAPKYSFSVIRVGLC